MKNVYSLDRIRRFVEHLFASAGDTSVLESETLPIEEDADFILLILAIIRSQERGMDYTIEMEEGRVDRNGYRIPKMKIRRKTEERKERQALKENGAHV
jgi:hypothetical protein